MVALCRAHDVRRPHSLVGRDQDEPLQLRLGSRFGDNLRAEHIIPRAFEFILFDQRNVLIGRRVKDDLDPLLRNHTCDTRLVGH